MAYRIGDLAKRTGTSTATIRYYEEIHLLPDALRQQGNQRHYGEDDARRLTFIRRCRDFGFSIMQVRTLVSLVQDRSRSCVEARDLASAHLEEVRDKLLELQALERSIVEFVELCEAECTGGPGPDCSILDNLSCVVPYGRGTAHK